MEQVNLQPHEPTVWSGLLPIYSSRLSESQGGALAGRGFARLEEEGDFLLGCWEGGLGPL